MPRSGRRRIPTLRREDVAWLADVGITWYTWLEQGRAIKIAPETLDRIAAALRLDPSESEYLRKLVQPNGKEAAHWESRVSDRVRALVDSYAAGYAFVMSPCWDVLAYNERFGGLFEMSGRGGEGLDRNALWMMFTEARARQLFPDWGATARRMVATLRVEYASYVHDRSFGELLAALSANSTEFARMWADVDVLSPTRWRVGEIRDPGSGHVLALDTVSLSVPDSPGQTLVFYVPASCELTARAG